jgi:two-component system, NarL family, response regulator LiaR
VGTSELADAVRKAAHGEAMLHPAVAARLVQQVRNPPREGSALVLSPRESEVLRLLADGSSNAAIAERLIISEYTVKNHVSNILSKLHLADRTQAAIYAWRTGFVDRWEV